MSAFRYAQFCPLARAAEVIGERWTLLVIRELFIGPQRFSDLLRRLHGVSSSVLTSRLAALEERGLVCRRPLPPPAASKIYELTEASRELYPAFRALTRWGLRFLSTPQPGDHFEPEWVGLGLDAFARKQPTPERSFEIRMPDSTRAPGADQTVRLRIAGGAEGTWIGPAGPAADLRIEADALVVLALASGELDGHRAQREGRIQCEGELSALADLPRLFDFPHSGILRGGPSPLRSASRARPPG